MDIVMNIVASINISLRGLPIKEKSRLSTGFIPLLENSFSG
jgi:hypothetical protein